MLASANYCEGIPARLYRSPCEIRRDMSEISKQIKETEQMLSVRNILVEVLSEWADGEPEKWIPELEELISEATEALESMKKFRRALTDLSEELEETLCVVERR